MRNNNLRDTQPNGWAVVLRKREKVCGRETWQRSKTAKAYKGCQNKVNKEKECWEDWEPSCAHEEEVITVIFCILPHLLNENYSWCFPLSPSIRCFATHCLCLFLEIRVSLISQWKRKMIQLFIWNRCVGGRKHWRCRGFPEWGLRNIGLEKKNYLKWHSNMISIIMV